MNQREPSILALIYEYLPGRTRAEFFRTQRESARAYGVLNSCLPLISYMERARVHGRERERERMQPARWRARTHRKSIRRSRRNWNSFASERERDKLSRGLIWTAPYRLTCFFEARRSVHIYAHVAAHMIVVLRIDAYIYIHIRDNTENTRFLFLWCVMQLYVYI